MSAVLLYDADCGFCARSANWATRLGCDVEPTPYQTWPHLAEHGITLAAADAAVHAVVDGQVSVGHEAIAATLATSDRWWARAGGRLTHACGPVSARVYAWVAAHRQQLPGGTPACALEERPR